MKSDPVLLKPKDTILIHCLENVLDGKIDLVFEDTDNGGYDYRTSIHSDGIRSHSFNRYNLREQDDCLRITPTVSGIPLTVSVEMKDADIEYEISFISAGKPSVEERCLNAELHSIRFIPTDNDYLVEFIYGSSKSLTMDETDCPGIETLNNHEDILNDDIVELIDTISENDVSCVSADAVTLADSTKVDRPDSISNKGKKPWYERVIEIVTTDSDESVQIESVQTENDSTIVADDSPLFDNVTDENGYDIIKAKAELALQQEKNLQIKKEIEELHRRAKLLEEESEKDYNIYQQELEDLSKRLEVDKEILLHFGDEYDIADINDTFKHIKMQLNDAERQINQFILMRQKKTEKVLKEIEN